MRLFSRIALCLLFATSVAFAQDTARVAKMPRVKASKTKSIRSTKSKAANLDPGIKKYGNVAFADPVHHKYPIDNAAHTRGSWSAINVKNHASKYKSEELAQMKQRIHDAGVAQGIKFKEDSPKTPTPKSTKSPSK